MVSEAASQAVEICVWVASVGFVVVAAITDLLHNPLHHKRRFIHFRFINWFLIGGSYALSYAARYNVNVVNIPRIRDKLDLSASEFGWIITVGFWGYAAFVFVNGIMVDRLGARKSVLMGCLGSGVINIIIGLFLTFSHARGLLVVVVVCYLVAVNNYAQTYSTAAICKAGVNWYPMRERGFFAGIFGVIIAFGFFLALVVNGVIVANMSYQWVFFIPGLAEVCAFAVCFMVIRSTPWDKGFTENDMGDDTVPPPSVASEKPPLRKLMTRVFLRPIFLVFCIAEICIGWCRDGILSWFSDYFDKVYGVHAGSACYALAAGGITVGGMFGSLSAGIASDLFFRSRRTPVAFLYCCGLVGMLTLLYFIHNAWLSAILIGACSLFFSGAHGIVTSTCAMDFAGSEATGTAVGLLDGVQKIASSGTGFLMGMIVEQSHQWWIFSMIPAAVLAASMFLILIGKKGKAQSKKAGKETKIDVDGEDDAEKSGRIVNGSVDGDDAFRESVSGSESGSVVEDDLSRGHDSEEERIPGEAETTPLCAVTRF